MKLLPQTTAKYGIEFESIIVQDTDFVCLDYYLSNILHKLSSEYFDYHSTFTCPTEKYLERIRTWKRVEYASRAFSPIDVTPKKMFEELKKIIDNFKKYTNDEYYLPEHGTFAYADLNKEKISTTLTGGTHFTVSFPVTTEDKPDEWKMFMKILIDLITIYQPVYIAVSGAPSRLTKGSERQRVSGSIKIGSSQFYDVFNSYNDFYPRKNHYFVLISEDYPEIRKEVRYWNHARQQRPWTLSIKTDIGNSYIDRADVYGLHRTRFRDELVKESLQTKMSFVRDVVSDGATINLIEFRYLDNEPVNFLLNNFNLIMRIADYAYDMAKNNSIDILEQTNLIPSEGYRALTKENIWNDVIASVNMKGLDAVFPEKYIKMINELFWFIENKEFKIEEKDYTPIDLATAFINEINESPRYFSAYFHTDDPKPIFSKSIQIEKYNESLNNAIDYLQTYQSIKRRLELED